MQSGGWVKREDGVERRGSRLIRAARKSGSACRSERIGYATRAVSPRAPRGNYCVSLRALGFILRACAIVRELERSLISVLPQASGADNDSTEVLTMESLCTRMCVRSTESPRREDFHAS